MNVISYEERVSKMQVPGDEDKQIKLAQDHARRIRNKAKHASKLSEKIDLNRSAKDAEAVLRKLRLNVFDLEDMLRARANTED